MDVDVDAALVDEVAAVVKLLDTAVYDVMEYPPSEVGGANATVTNPFPGVGTTLLGAPGTVTLSAEGGLAAPLKSVANTVNA